MVPEGLWRTCEGFLCFGVLALVRVDHERNLRAGGGGKSPLSSSHERQSGAISLCRERQYREEKVSERDGDLACDWPFNRVQDTES